MTQLNFFPPPGAISESLPPEALYEAAQTLAELLVAIVKNAAVEATDDRGDNHE